MVTFKFLWDSDPPVTFTEKLLNRLILLFSHTLIANSIPYNNIGVEKNQGRFWSMVNAEDQEKAAKALTTVYPEVFPNTPRGKQKLDDFMAIMYRQLNRLDVNKSTPYSATVGEVAHYQSSFARSLSNTFFP